MERICSSSEYFSRILYKQTIFALSPSIFEPSSYSFVYWEKPALYAIPVSSHTRLPAVRICLPEQKERIAQVLHKMNLNAVKIL